MIGANVTKLETPTISLEVCIAKTTDNRPGISVENHCRVVGLVAREILKLLPDAVRTELFPEGTDLVAASHDIGKVSPAFQKMIYENLPTVMQQPIASFSMVNADNAKRKCAGFHAAVSQISFANTRPHIAEILGIHHGFTPATNHMQKGCILHGGEEWQKEREELLTHLRAFFSYADSFWPEYSETQARVVSGLVTVADWIGSGDYFADYVLDSVLSRPELEVRALEAIVAAGFRKVRVRFGLSFQEVFPFAPNEIQTTLVTAVDRPGVYILEAPMGIGKTEAALYAAYKLIEKESATGIYFALPTQLTSEKIYERMEMFLERIIEPASGIGHAHLLHGAAWLRETTMGVDADVGGSWFNGSKRGILAPFAAGTIDQALMAVMNVRHGFVRTFGLAGKVVILDEVHSYDSFTGTILNRLVDELRKLHCTVIILSATLTARQRRSLCAIDESHSLSANYPLVSALPTGLESELSELSCPSAENAEVKVNCTTDFDSVIENMLDRALRGEQVLWIENTVTEAQEIFKRLSTKCLEMNIECGLLHSRFLKRDREKIENEWVSIFGKSGKAKRTEKGRILIGTQVLEQSIDIDADYLVSRLCPTDMLLQRIGRLWRHRENDTLRHSIGSRREVTILSPLFIDAIEKPKQFGTSGAVYSEYVLLRTLEIWKDLSKVAIPGDIRRLIENTYKDRGESGLSARYKAELCKKKEILQSLARVGLSKGIETLPESRASTRYSELETIDVLLLAKKRTTETEMELFFLDGSSIVAPVLCTNRTTRREVASAIMKNTVRVADYIAPESSRDLSKFAQFVYTGSKDDGEEPFRVAIVARDDEITGDDGTRANAGYVLHYDSIIGYQSEKE